MSDYTDTLQKLVTDLRIGISLCTRLPIGPIDAVGEGDVARASWTFPIAGLLVGLTGAIAYWLAVRVNVAPLPAAALALAATLLLTGAMHEDGLADTADGLGGATREKKLEIMRDSRIGTFGACALAVSLMLRWSALADIAEPRVVALALICAHVSARALRAGLHVSGAAGPRRRLVERRRSAAVCKRHHGRSCSASFPYCLPLGRPARWSPCCCFYSWRSCSRR